MLVFCIKKKEVYEMRIRDWSSEVCSSDILDHAQDAGGGPGMDDRPQVRGRVRRVADFQLLRCREELLQERVIDRRFHDYPLSGDTLLPACLECRGQIGRAHV